MPSPGRDTRRRRGGASNPPLAPIVARRRRAALFPPFVVVLLLLLAAGSGLGLARAFFSACPPPPPTTTTSRHRRMGSLRLAVGCSSMNEDDSGDGDNEGVFFYDDFGGDDDGNANPSSSSMSYQSSKFDDERLLSKALKSRMVDVRDAEVAYDAKIARNWRRGNWSVRGFSLDKFASFSTPSSHSSSDAAPNGAAAPARGGGSDVVRVSFVAAPTSAIRDGDDCYEASTMGPSMPQDYALRQDVTVAVGRTDGSVCIVRLGDDYLTNFVSAVESNENETDDGRLLKGSNPRTDEDESSVPFVMRHQFLASESGEPIRGLVYHDAFDGKNGDGRGGGVVCTVAGASGEIVVWNLPPPRDYDDYENENESENGNDDSDVGGVVTRAAILGVGVHADRIVSLRTMILRSNVDGMDDEGMDVLFSASEDGTIALWNLANCELMLSRNCADANSGRIMCADVYNPSSWDDGYGDVDRGDNNEDVIFLGTSGGYVFGYAVRELMMGVRDDNAYVNASPNIRFRAHGTERGNGDAVTAIKCGGIGTIPTTSRSSNPALSSSILLTGGEDGSVKQWEILSQKTQSSPPSVRMEHWPRMSTQRMKRRAHLFTPSHDGPVTCISHQGRGDPSKFLTSGEDGSVCVWSSSSGKELFRMDGFGIVTSLAFLGRELLVTDGMDEYVCVHDFGIAEDAASNGYELEW